jgi:hypothetical protein
MLTLPRLIVIRVFPLPDANLENVRVLAKALWRGRWPFPGQSQRQRAVHRRMASRVGRCIVGYRRLAGGCGGGRIEHGEVHGLSALSTQAIPVWLLGNSALQQLLLRGQRRRHFLVSSKFCNRNGSQLGSQEAKRGWDWKLEWRDEE